MMSLVKMRTLSLSLLSDPLQVTWMAEDGHLGSSDTNTELQFLGYAVDLLGCGAGLTSSKEFWPLPLAPGR